MIDVSVLEQALEVAAAHAMASAVRIFNSQRITSPRQFAWQELRQFG
ncbi:MAG TPA: hypothetical protein VKE51_03725 [Vicinamibacterales bacterium]|nr:hypothetical protein [Vicinamibacterales bacterium]